MDKIEILGTGVLAAGALVWVCKAFFDRLLGVIDKNTEAVSKMEVTLEKLGVHFESQRARQEMIEDEVKGIRERHHEFVNHVQAMFLSLELKLMKALREKLP